MHYTRHMRSGTLPEWHKAVTPLAQRWAEKVQWTPECWIWIGARKRLGYGHLSIGRSDGVILAHRAAYLIYRGPIPDDLDLDHLCRNPSCVNPWHLEPVTRRENSLRGKSPTVIAYLKGECRRGHRFTDKTTYWQAGNRICRICRDERMAKWRRNRAA